MHANLVELVRRRRDFVHRVEQRRPPRRRRRLPRQQQPDGIRLRYFRALVQLLEQAKGLVDRRILPRLPELVREAARARGDNLDAGPGDVNDEMEAIASEFFEEVSGSDLSSLSEAFARATSDFQREQLAKQIKAQIGVEVPISDPTLGPLIDQFTSENVALIKSVPRRYFDQVEKEVLSGLREGERWEEIATQLQERFAVAESSAQLIARDQVGKFYGNMNEARQTRLGIDGYIWRTENDSRVREEHALREGERFEWAEPPEDGHPGEPILCRCFAEPDLSAILEEL